MDLEDMLLASIAQWVKVCVGQGFGILGLGGVINTHPIVPIV